MSVIGEGGEMVRQWCFRRGRSTFLSLMGCFFNGFYLFVS